MIVPFWTPWFVDEVFSGIVGEMPTNNELSGLTQSEMPRHPKAEAHVLMKTLRARQASVRSYSSPS
jgi:hypothetical protein